MERLVVGLAGMAAWAIATVAAAAPATGAGLRGELDPQPIIGGDETKPGDFDGVVALTIGSELCTGTVVAPRLILTAAHCLVDADQVGRLVVRYGDDVYGGAVEADGWGMHPDFSPKSKTDIFDYGYVTLPVDFTVPGGYTTPIVDQDEWDEAMRKGETVTLVGYGGDSADRNAVYGAGLKREVDTTISRFTPKGFEFFAGGSQRDTCSGDSGGPAFVRLGNGALRLAGITSRGTDPCGNGGYYGAPYPALCWVRDETGVDLVGEACSACDCLDTAPPDEGGRCSVGDEHDPLELAWCLLALVGLRAARRRRAR